ncbi:hypothetical protein M6B38_108615 [Iris pallida]|uniref:Uncharacterized protein n=1 Tax=Iris pallida TaxID=29817 RepID=A0AAX6EH45_IRIPA|nr:hypothetical protein M6B38_110000 [Iris pallida]KAJ6801422.1 hypothetical protein M6B38_197810 [Iris pallida]KAJ6803422.1 hypothetical protein M6B38_108615 [Iris pallida]
MTIETRPRLYESPPLAIEAVAATGHFDDKFPTVSFRGGEGSTLPRRGVVWHRDTSVDHW